MRVNVLLKIAISHGIPAVQSLYLKDCQELVGDVLDHGESVVLGVFVEEVLHIKIRER